MLGGYSSSLVVVNRAADAVLVSFFIQRRGVNLGMQWQCQCAFGGSTRTRREVGEQMWSCCCMVQCRGVGVAVFGAGSAIWLLLSDVKRVADFYGGGAAGTVREGVLSVWRVADHLGDAEING